ncbi:MAG: hypothetical protein GWP03_05230 [Proteobacteria bacterium]|nr:hypothetical protein [Pseudomonadota bacterium]
MENNELIRKFHKKAAIDLFNYIRSLMDKEVRSKEEKEYYIAPDCIARRTKFWTKKIKKVLEQ